MALAIPLLLYVDRSTGAPSDMSLPVMIRVNTVNMVSG